MTTIPRLSLLALCLIFATLITTTLATSAVVTPGAKDAKDFHTVSISFTVESPLLPFSIALSFAITPEMGALTYHPRAPFPYLDGCIVKTDQAGSTALEIPQRSTLPQDRLDNIDSKPTGTLVDLITFRWDFSQINTYTITCSYYTPFAMPIRVTATEGGILNTSRILFSGAMAPPQSLSAHALFPTSITFDHTLPGFDHTIYIGGIQGFASEGMGQLLRITMTDLVVTRCYTFDDQSPSNKSAEIVINTPASGLAFPQGLPTNAMTLQCTATTELRQPTTYNLQYNLASDSTASATILTSTSSTLFEPTLWTSQTLPPLLPVRLVGVEVINQPHPNIVKYLEVNGVEMVLTHNYIIYKIKLDLITGVEQIFKLSQPPIYRHYLIFAACTTTDLPGPAILVNPQGNGVRMTFESGAARTVDIECHALINPYITSIAHPPDYLYHHLDIRMELSPNQYGLQMALPWQILNQEMFEDLLPWKELPDRNSLLHNSFHIEALPNQYGLINSSNKAKWIIRARTSGVYQGELHKVELSFSTQISNTVSSFQSANAINAPQNGAGLAFMDNIEVFTSSPLTIDSYIRRYSDSSTHSYLIDPVYNIEIDITPFLAPITSSSADFLYTPPSSTDNLNLFAVEIEYHGHSYKQQIKPIPGYVPKVVYTGNGLDTINGNSSLRNLTPILIAFSPTPRDYPTVKNIALSYPANSVWRVFQHTSIIPNTQVDLIINLSSNEPSCEVSFFNTLPTSPSSYWTVTSIAINTATSVRVSVESRNIDNVVLTSDLNFVSIPISVECMIAPLSISYEISSTITTNNYGTTPVYLHSKKVWYGFTPTDIQLGTTTITLSSAKAPTTPINIPLQASIAFHSIQSTANKVFITGPGADFVAVVEASSFKTVVFELWYTATNGQEVKLQTINQDALVSNPLRFSAKLPTVKNIIIDAYFKINYYYDNSMEWDGVWVEYSEAFTLLPPCLKPSSAAAPAFELTQQVTVNSEVIITQTSSQFPSQLSATSQFTSQSSPTSQFTSQLSATSQFTSQLSPTSQFTSQSTPFISDCPVANQVCIFSTGQCQDITINIDPIGDMVPPTTELCPKCEQTNSQTCTPFSVSSNTLETCQCKSGWEGPYCKQSTSCDPTKSKCIPDNGYAAPLPNSKKCESKCNCYNQWAGLSCQTCQLQCLNGGEAYNDCARCGCQEGYTGSQCQCSSVNAKVTLFAWNQLIKETQGKLSTATSSSPLFTIDHTKITSEYKFPSTDLIDVNLISLLQDLYQALRGDLTKNSSEGKFAMTVKPIITQFKPRPDDLNPNPIAVDLESTEFSFDIIFNCNEYNPNITSLENLKTIWNDFANKLSKNTKIQQYFVFSSIEGAQSPLVSDITPVPPSLPGDGEKLTEINAGLPLDGNMVLILLGCIGIFLSL